jgi:hypothetical protein
MTPRSAAAGLLSLPALLVLAACASKPDSFYSLDPLYEAHAARSPTLHVRLDVTIPSVVDRAEMVLNTSQNSLQVLEHERWGAPLADEVSQTLARDIEARRSDIIVGDRSFDQPASPPVMVKVDLVRMTAQRGGEVIIEAHWRVVDGGGRSSASTGAGAGAGTGAGTGTGAGAGAAGSAGTDVLGSGTFTAATQGTGYAAIAQAYSRTLIDLADRLTPELRSR